MLIVHVHARNDSHRWTKPSIVTPKPLCFITPEQEAADLKKMLAHCIRIGKVAKSDLYDLIVLVAKFLANLPISLPSLGAPVKMSCHAVKINAKSS